MSLHHFSPLIQSEESLKMLEALIPSGSLNGLKIHLVCNKVLLFDH